jgi:serine/threonine-protein kinase
MQNGNAVPPAPSAVPGLIAGRYLIGESFASGGTGTVHLGRIVGAGGFSRVVAVKRLFPYASRDRGFREMLLEEARLVSRIRHPNVVPALDVVEEGDDVYIVMEYIGGPSLAELLARARSSAEPMPVDIAVCIVEAALHGLHAAHEARGEEGMPLGIVHRDVSPHNILVGADGVTRLIDFGIAKAATRIQITDPGVLKGKMGYMAPEQFLHQPVSRHTDVYATSIVLWEALTNQRLFQDRARQLQKGEGDTSVRRALETKPTPPSHSRSGVDAALDAVVLRGLELEPSDRFPTAEAMAVELRRVHGVASAVDVARWLERFAPEELEIAGERVRLLEQAPLAAPADAESTAAVQVDWSVATSGVERPRAGWRGRVIGLGAIALGVAGIAWVIGAKVPLRAVGGVAPPPAPSSSFKESPSTMVPAAMLPSPGASPAAPPSSPAPSAAAPPSSPRPIPDTVVSSSAHPARKTAKSQCDPPYTIDANGHKHYHPNCF